MDDISDIYSEFENASNKREISYVPIVLMQVGMAAAIDPRLVNPDAPDEENSLVNSMVREVVNERERSGGKCQVIFCDRYRTMDTSILGGLRSGGMSNANRLIELEDADALTAGERKENGAEEEEAVVEEVVSGVGEFNLYHDIRDKLVRAGYKRENVLIPGEAKTGKSGRLCSTEPTKTRILS